MDDAEADMNFSVLLQWRVPAANSVGRCISRVIVARRGLESAVIARASL